jgi:acyl-CoA thioesterase FadM
MTSSTVEQVVTVQARPRYEGSNICTWIGFKHVMYLIEEAVLEAVRQSTPGAQALFEADGLGVDIVDSDARILTALHIDDVARTEVTRQSDDGSGELAFRTVTWLDRPGRSPQKAVTAKVRVVLRRVTEPPAAPPTPAELAAATVPEIQRAPASAPPRPSFGTPTDQTGGVIGRGVVGAADQTARSLGAGSNALVWKWRIPYFYCHFTERIQHSGYLRIMEEVVDLFLADRGISIRRMLDDQKWIPVVPQARVEILREALMEEELYTVFTVEDVFKDLTYTARMDCYVLRGDELVQTATGRITHGYALILDRHAWEVVPFDERTLAALRGEPLPATNGGAPWTS